jgi:DNA repair protein RecN (Recombination protein N)
VLQNIYIKNYILISELNIEFNKGFTTITGETGAGKSILLGALSLLTGSRTDTSVLFDKEKKCIVEGFFELANYNLEPLFSDLDIDYDNTTIIRREINKAGKSRAFINDTPVNISTLKIIGEKLIDIHSQHNNLSLKDNSFYFQVVDSFAKLNKQITDYRAEFKIFGKKTKELNELKEQLAKEKQELDYHQFQFDTLNNANLIADEQDELEQELKKLNNSEEIKQNLSKIYFELEESDESIISKLKDIENTFTKLNSLGIEGEYAKRIESIIIELKDIAEDSDSINSEIIFDALKIEELNERLNLIYELQHKYSVSTITELITIKNELEEKLLSFNTNDTYLKKLTKEVEQLNNELLTKAKKISETRTKSKSEIEKNISANLVELGIKNAQFNVVIEQSKTLSQNGIDKIQFLFSANKNVKTADIAKAASGGELSRIMLSLKNMLASSNNLPTIIFDEIDTGVSGDIASKTADIMQKLSEKTQVISITHLPQIAAKGNEHLIVYKTDTNNTTETSIKKITDKDRISELAKMLSGKNITDAAMQNAAELLK